MDGGRLHQVRVSKRNPDDWKLNNGYYISWSEKEEEKRNETMYKSNNLQRNNSRSGRLSLRMSAVKMNANQKFGSLKLKMNKLTKWIQRTAKGNGYEGKSYSPLRNAKSPVKLYSPFYIVTPSPRTQESKRRQNLHRPRRCEFSSPVA
ncbi:uncharacterized protein LOC111637771 [Centruroides sculpturatus]|uniref:uncharacterized protein LOC111637771 n=1 Tax=Centruroides sculpturatus TaxID=218467 RepID=UPI000C6E209B|nr:uncharacterized protein LOC111637771 [Centruroides sculpturatus]